MGKNDSEDVTMSEGTDALSLSGNSDLSMKTTSDSLSSDSSESYSDEDIDTDIEEQLCSLEEERQKILKKLKKFELEKQRKKMKKKMKKAKEKKRLKKLKKKKARKKKRKKYSSSSSSSSSDSESDTRQKRKKKRRKSSSSSSSSSSEAASTAVSTSSAADEPLEKAKDSPIVIQESATESSVDEAPIDPSLGSRLGPSTANANLLENMEKKMSGQKLPEKSSIEKFHQERSDQDVTGRVIKGRKIVVKAKTSPFVTVLSSGQSSPRTNPNSPQPNISGTLSDRFGDSNRREDRKLNLLNPLLRKAKFYIIKSVFDENVDISQEKGVWATLPHNEKKFNNAFCEVENVFFFFIVNQSQRFRGFARMKAPAKRNKEEIAWKLPDKMKAHGFSFGEVIKKWPYLNRGTELDWISSQSVPFQKVRDLRNQLNKNNPVWAGRDGQEIDPETGRDLSLSFHINKDINELVIRNFKNYTQVARLEYEEQSKLKREAVQRKRSERHFNNELAEKRARKDSESKKD